MSSDEQRPTYFTPRPTQPDESPRLEIARTPPTKKIQAIVLSHDLTGTNTHYWHGRTLPCTGDDCPACREKVSRRWYGYLAIMGATTRRILIFETTASTIQPIDQYFAQFKTLRSAQLTAFRSPARANGRVIIELTPPRSGLEFLPPSPDVEAILMKMWEATWARDNLNIRPNVPKGREQAYADTVERETEHKKNSASTPKRRTLERIGDTLGVSHLLRTSTNDVNEKFPLTIVPKNGRVRPPEQEH